MNLSKLLKSALIYGGAYALIPIFKFFIIPVYVRYLNPEEYGIVNMALTISGFLAMILTMGLDGAAAREYFDYKDEINFKKYLIVIGWFLLVVNLIVLCILSLTGFYFKDYIKAKYSLDFFPYIVMAFVIAFLNPFNSVATVILQSKQKAAMLSFAQISRVVISASVALILLIAFKAGSVALLWSEITALSLVSLRIWIEHLSGISHFYSSVKEALKQKKTILSQSLLYGLPFIPQNIFNWILAAADRWILVEYVSIKAVGIYSLGFNVAFGMQLILTSLNNAYLPFFLENAEKRNYKQTHNIISQMYVIVLGMACLLIGGFSDEIICLIAPAEYGEAGKVLQILTISYYWVGIYLMVSLPIYHVKKTKILPMLVGFSSVINIIANFILIPLFGILGAPLSKIVSYVLYAVSAWFFSERLYPIRYPFCNFWLVAIFASLMPILLNQQQLMFRLFIMAMLMFISVLRIKMLFDSYDSSDSGSMAENKVVLDFN